jgi:hypothetical protein
MMLRTRKWRVLKANDLVLEFNRILDHAHVMKGRDGGFLSRVMENNALDSVDVLWAMYRYRETASARDIPTFCRWLNRNIDLFAEDRLAREGELARDLSETRLPASALVYYDLLYEPEVSAVLERSFRAARVNLQDYVAQILGAV